MLVNFELHSLRSSGKSITGSLLFASRYIKLPFSDYLLYIHAYDIRDGTADTFAAVAILWRRGRRVPLQDGEMAQLVEVQSFGTAGLHQKSIEVLGNYCGHFPGVPANMLQLQPPVNWLWTRQAMLWGTLKLMLLEIRLWQTGSRSL